MKKIRKIIINIVLIIFVMSFIYYFGGYYFSQEKCISDSLNSLYTNETEFIMQFQNKNHYKTLMLNPDEMTCSIVGTQKVGFLYRIGSGSHGNSIDQDESLDIIGQYNIDTGLLIIVYRNNKNIERVDVKLEDGTSFVLDEWTKDFAGVLLDKDDWLNGVYTCYDSNHQLIDEIEY